jgi:hypothetical protein
MGLSGAVEGRGFGATTNALEVVGASHKLDFSTR